MATATWLALLSNKHEHVMVFDGKRCNAGVVTTRGEAAILDELGRQHIDCSVGRSSPEELPIVLQLERQVIDHDAMENVKK